VSGVFASIFEKHRVIGVVGNRSSAKSSLVLSQLVALKKEHPKISIYVYGVEEKLKDYLVSQGITWIYNKNDILQMKIRDSVIFLEEVGEMFSTISKNKETDKVKKFFNRISHLNNYIVLGTAETGWFNKLACSFIECFIVKRIDFDKLVNGTFLKRMVLGLEKYSDYQLELDTSEYFVLSEGLTEKKTFVYDPNLDSKIDNVNLFKKMEYKVGQKMKQKVGQKMGQKMKKTKEKLI
jgi:hypothetical protein